MDKNNSEKNCMCQNIWRCMYHDILLCIINKSSEWHENDFWLFWKSNYDSFILRSPEHAPVVSCQICCRYVSSTLHDFINLLWMSLSWKQRYKIGCGQLLTLTPQHFSTFLHAIFFQIMEIMNFNHNCCAFFRNPRS